MRDVVFVTYMNVVSRYKVEGRVNGDESTAFYRTRKYSHHDVDSGCMPLVIINKPGCSSLDHFQNFGPLGIFGVGPRLCIFKSKFKYWADLGLVCLFFSLI